MLSSCKKAYPNPFYCHFGLGIVKLWISFPLAQCKINLENKINSLPTYPIFFYLGDRKQTYICFWPE